MSRPPVLQPIVQKGVTVPLKFKITSAGFGLIEVMIAAAIISIIALGIGTLVDDMMKAQRKTNVSAAIASVRTRIIANIQDGGSWSNTGLDATLNPDLGCMRPLGGNCNVAAPFLINLKGAAANEEVMYARTATKGFDYEGRICNTFPTAPCVFRYSLMYNGTCPGAAVACRAPAVRISADLEYVPGGLELPGGLNLAQFSINEIRGTAATRSDAVMVAFVMQNDTGEGACQPTWFNRQLNRAISDPGDNLRNGSTGSVLAPVNVVQLRPGTYNCRVVAPGFKHGSSRIRLLRTSDNAVLGESSAGNASLNGGSVSLVIESTLILDADTDLVVQQRCDSNPNGVGATLSADCLAGGTTCSNDPLWSLGVPTKDGAGLYNDVTYTTVSCARTS